MIDDEVDLTAALAEYLGDAGYDVVTATSVATGGAVLAEAAVDLVVLDLSMPGGGGLDLLRTLRTGAAKSVPVLILTALAEPIERVVGLELGADDFLVKPVEPRELAARISGILCRLGMETRETVPFERATVDLTTSRLLRHGAPPERLGPGEVVLIRIFARNPNRVMAREDLLEAAPANSLDANDRSIDTRITRLRRKLDTDAIVTVRGRGYMFVPPMPDLPAGATGDIDAPEEA